MVDVCGFLHVLFFGGYKSKEREVFIYGVKSALEVHVFSKNLQSQSKNGGVVMYSVAISSLNANSPNRRRIKICQKPNKNTRLLRRVFHDSLVNINMQLTEEIPHHLECIDPSSQWFVNILPPKTKCWLSKIPSFWSRNVLIFTAHHFIGSSHSFIGSVHIPISNVIDIYTMGPKNLYF